MTRGFLPAATLLASVVGGASRRPAGSLQRRIRWSGPRQTACLRVPNSHARRRITVLAVPLALARAR